MFVSPSCASLAIFADKNSKTHAGATVTILAALTEFHQPIAQFIVVSRRWGSSCNGLGRRGCTIFWRHNEPSAVGPLLITSVLVVPIAARPWLALCRYGRTRYTADDCTSCRPSAAAYCAANDGPSGAAQDRAAYRVLRGRILHWHRKRNGQKD
jgi:hypothetical protein